MYIFTNEDFAIRIEPTEHEVYGMLYVVVTHHFRYNDDIDFSVGAFDRPDIAQHVSKELADAFIDANPLPQFFDVGAGLTMMPKIGKLEKKYPQYFRKVFND